MNEDCPVWDQPDDEDWNPEAPYMIDDIGDFEFDCDPWGGG